MPITNEQVVLLATAATLMARFASHLSEFEVAMIAGLGRRYLHDRADMVATSREWSIIEDAVRDMEQAQARALAGTRAA